MYNQLSVSGTQQEAEGEGCLVQTVDGLEGQTGQPEPRQSVRPALSSGDRGQNRPGSEGGIQGPTEHPQSREGARRQKWALTALMCLFCTSGAHPKEDGSH